MVQSMKKVKTSSKRKEKIKTRVQNENKYK